MSRSRAACGVRWQNIKREPGRYGKDKIKTVQEKRGRALFGLGFVNYRAYLRSDLWKSIRQLTMEATPLCEACGSTGQCVHHLDYSKLSLLGKKPWKLVVLCNDCHKRIEFKEDGSKRNFKGVIDRTKTILIRRGRWDFHKKH